MEERCELCKHFHRLKYNFQCGVGFKESYCCDVLLHLDDGDEGWVQEIGPDDMCEMFVRNAT